MKYFSKKISPVLIYIVFAAVLINLSLIFFYAPEENVQGLVQKIFYFHVSSAFAMYIGFVSSGLAAIMYLFKKTPVWNALSHAAASVGLLFCTMVLVSGPIWAKPIWGAWWTWDPRLTTTMILWLIFFATLLLRNFYGTDHRGRIYAAVLTLFGVLDIPLIIFAVKLWRGIHPSVLGNKDSMPGEMRITLIVSMLTIFFFLFVLIRVLTRQKLLEDKFEVLTGHLSERSS